MPFSPKTFLRCGGLLAAFSLICFLSGAAADETPRRRVVPGEIYLGLAMGPESNFILSPDGRWLGFHNTKGRGYLDLTTGKSTSFSFDYASGDWFTLTDIQPVAWWSPKGDTVVWTHYRKGKSAVAIWPFGAALDAPGAKDLLEIPRSLYRLTHNPMVWSPDGGTIYLVVNQSLRKNKIWAKEDNPPTKSVNVEISLSGIYSHEEDYIGYDKLYPEAYAESFRSLILAVDVATGKFGVLAKGNDIGTLHLSPDGRYLATMQVKMTNRSKDDPATNFEQAYGDIYVIETAKVETLPTIDLEKMDDRTAGWFDYRGRRLAPVQVEVCVDGSNFYFDPFRDLPQKATGTHGNPQLIWCPDSSCFAFATVGRQSSGDVFVYDVATQRTRNLTESIPPLKIGAKQNGYFENQRSPFTSPKFGGIFGPLWLKDGKSLVVKGRGDVWLISLDPGEPPQDVTAQFDQEIIRILPAPGLTQAAVDAAGRIAVVTKGRLSRTDTVWKLDLLKRELTKVADTGVCTSLQLLTDERTEYMVYTGQTATSPTNLYRLNLNGTADAGNKPEYVTKYKLELNDRIFPESRVISWKTPEGYPGYGILYLPEGASPEKKVPLIFNGYPAQTVSRPDARAHEGASFYRNELAGLLSDGFAFLYADIPMSDQGVYEHPMMQIVNDVKAAVSAAVATGCVDEKRMAIMGTSYGGFMVNAALSQTDLFKTGVSISGISDLNAFYLGNTRRRWKGDFDKSDIESWTGWAEYRQGRIGGKLWEAPDRFAENSPLSYWDKIKVPVLFIHGAQDSTVLPFYGEESYKGLKIQNKTAIYALYGRMEHGVPDSDGEALGRIRGWLREQLLGMPPITQTADQGIFFLGTSPDSLTPVPPYVPPSPPTLPPHTN